MKLVAEKNRLKGPRVSRIYERLKSHITYLETKLEEVTEAINSRCREIENCCHCETTRGRSNPNIKEL